MKLKFEILRNYSTSNVYVRVYYYKRYHINNKKK